MPCVFLTCLRGLIISETLALYKLFTYLLTYLVTYKLYFSACVA